MNSMLPERRKMQRDWIGHALQLVGFVVVIGVPLLYWGIGTNAALATLGQRVDRQDHDMADFRAFQILETTQMLDLNKQLATIAAQLGDIRDHLVVKEHK